MLKGHCRDYIFFRFMASSDLSIAVFKISKCGYKYYTSYSLLKLLYIIHPVVWARS